MDFLKTGLIALAIAVMLGAFGAHGLENMVSERSLEVWKTGVEYQFIHALGIVLLSIVPPSFVGNQKRLRMAQQLMFAGIFFFSGSLYLLSTLDVTGLSIGKVIGPITPIGGLLFIVGWVLAALSVSTKPKA
jgi:uncharacterized membrane protein YgdD (TMEM256/DUF423 family)